MSSSTDQITAAIALLREHGFLVLPAPTRSESDDPTQVHLPTLVTVPHGEIMTRGGACFVECSCRKWDGPLRWTEASARDSHRRHVEAEALGADHD